MYVLVYAILIYVRFTGNRINRHLYQQSCVLRVTEDRRNGPGRQQTRRDKYDYIRFKVLDHHTIIDIIQIADTPRAWS